MFFERAELMWTVWNGYSAYTTLMGMLLLPNFKQKKQQWNDFSKLSRDGAIQPTELLKWLNYCT